MRRLAVALAALSLAVLAPFTLPAAPARAARSSRAYPASAAQRSGSRSARVIIQAIGRVAEDRKSANQPAVA